MASTNKKASASRVDAAVASPMTSAETPVVDPAVVGETTETAPEPTPDASEVEPAIETEPAEDDADEAPVPVAPPVKMVYVVPRETRVVRVGQDMLSLTKGARCAVPSTAVDHLKRVELI